MLMLTKNIHGICGSSNALDKIFCQSIRQGFIQLGYFSGPWIIQITFILFTILWGFGEFTRVNFLRRQGRVLNALNLKWQENVCKKNIHCFKTKFCRTLPRVSVSCIFTKYKHRTCEVFLSTQRPLQSKPTVNRILQEPFNFCSLSCKVDHLVDQGENLSTILHSIDKSEYCILTI